MRSGLDVTTAALYDGGAYDTHWRVTLENGDGTFQSLEGRYTRFSVSLSNPNEPVGSASIELVRELQRDETGTSYSPLVEASSLNRLDDGTTYDPLVQIGRQIIFEVHLTEVGGDRPLDGSPDWYEFFRGVVRGTDWADYQSRTQEVEILGLASVLQKAKSEAEYTYSSGDSIETVAGEIIANNGWGATFSVYFPSATGKVLTANYAPGLQKPVWTQLTDLAKSIGWQCEFRYRGHGAAEITFFEPSRTKAVSDMTVKADDWRSLAIDEEEIREPGYLVYYDENGAQQQVGPAENTTARAKYGGSLGIRRPFWISLPLESPIRAEADALAMLTAAATDVADPDLIGVASTLPLPFGECATDLYQVDSLERFYDTTQNLALFTNSIFVEADQDPRGAIGLRGKPGSGSNYWRSVASVVIGDNTTLGDNWVEITHEGLRTNGIVDVGGENFQAWNRYCHLNVGPGVRSLHVELRSPDLQFNFPASGWTRPTIDYDIDLSDLDQVDGATAEGQVVRHVIEVDGGGAPYDFAIKYHEGLKVRGWDQPHSIYVTPYTEPGGEAGSGTAGLTKRIKTKLISEYDDVGIRTEQLGYSILEGPYNTDKVDVGTGWDAIGGDPLHYDGIGTIVLQTFEDEDISRAMCVLRGVGSPTGTITMRIRDYGGSPATYISGSVLGTATVEAADVDNAAAEDVIFEFDPPASVSGGTNFVVSIEYDGGDASNYVDIQTVNNGTGMWVKDESGVWSASDPNYSDWNPNLYRYGSQEIFGRRLTPGEGLVARLDATTGEIIMDAGGGGLPDAGVYPQVLWTNNDAPNAAEWTTIENPLEALDLSLPEDLDMRNVQRVRFGDEIYVYDADEPLDEKYGYFMVQSGRVRIGVDTDALNNETDIITLRMGTGGGVDQVVINPLSYNGDRDRIKLGQMNGAIEIANQIAQFSVTTYNILSNSTRDLEWDYGQTLLFRMVSGDLILNVDEDAWYDAGGDKHLRPGLPWNDLWVVNDDVVTHTLTINDVDTWVGGVTPASPIGIGNQSWLRFYKNPIDDEVIGEVLRNNVP